MDKQDKTLLITLGIAVIILFIARPKKSILTSSSEKPEAKNTSLPVKSDNKSMSTSNNGVTAIKAMRSALNDNVSQSEANELQSLLLKKYGLRVVLENNKLIAKDKNGKIIAKE